MEPKPSCLTKTKSCLTKTKEKAEKIPLPYLMDLVEENARNRFIFPLVALAIYILLAVSIAPGAAEVIYLTLECPD